MSDYDLEGGELDGFDDDGLGEEFVEPAADLLELAGASPAGSSVTSRFFRPDGSVREEPLLEHEDAMLASWAEQAREQEAVAPPPIDSTLLPHQPQSPEADHFDALAVGEAVMARNARAFEQALLAEVAELGARPEYGVRDPERLRQVAGEVEEWRRGWFEDQLAAGATVQQALSGLGKLSEFGYVQQAIEQRLVAARYERLTANTKMRRDSERWAQLDALNEDYLGGARAEPAWQRSPSLQRQWAAMQAREARLQSQRDQLKAIRAEGDYVHNLNRPLYERAYQATKTRKLGS